MLQLSDRSFRWIWRILVINLCVSLVILVRVEAFHFKLNELIDVLGESLSFVQTGILQVFQSLQNLFDLFGGRKS